MGILDLLGSAPYEDPVLGVLRRVRGRWNGSLTLGAEGAVPLLLSGERDRPDETSLILARAVPEKYPSLREDIQNHLFDHYGPYEEAITRGQLDDPGLSPRIQAPRGVWPYTKVERVLIEPMGKQPTIEIAYRVAWDPEHTVGAWIRDWRVFELCGSVGP